MESIAAVAPNGATAAYRIAFRNGDRLTVRFPADLRPLPFDTVLGPVPLPLASVASLAISGPPDHKTTRPQDHKTTRPPDHKTTRPQDLLYHCTFDDAASIECPAAGPAGRFLGGTFVPGKNGRALRVEADTPAFETKLPKGFVGPEGCLEFWAKIEGDNPRYVGGGDPLFVSLYNERRSITLLQFAANNGFARGGLGGAMAGWPFGTIPHYAGSMEYRKVLGDNWADWHHYAMSWKSDGFGDGSFVKVFVDGRPQPVLGGVDDDKVPARLADYGNHAYDLGIPWHASSTDRRCSKKPFLVDDLKIWSVAKTDFECDRPIQPSSFSIRHSELLYYCTLDDAQSIERPAVGPNGTFLGGDFVPGKVGRALLVKAGTPAAEVPFPTGLMQPEGCIEFWGKIPGATKETRYPDGGNPQFFAMGVGRWVNTLVKYTANDGFGTGGLHADLPGSAYISSRPSWSGSAIYPDFLGDPAAWHHYALVWSEKGLDAASEALGRRVVSALYVDGKLVKPAYGTNGPDRAKFLREFVVNPVVLGFPYPRNRNENNASAVDYLIDEFKIWSAPKTDFGIPSAEPPKLLYHCSFDSPVAVERPAAGPNGRFLGGEFVPGKVGNALRTFADEPAAEVDFEPGILGPRGTIEFWAKKEKSEKGSFAESEGLRFFGLWLYAKGETPPWCSTHFEFSSNDGMGMSGLCGMVNHCSWATKPSFGGWPYDIIRDSLFDWHHYAVVWDAEGLPGTKAPDGGPAVVQVYLDGKPVSTQGRQTVSFGGKHLRNISPQWGKLAFPTPSNGWNPSRSRIPYLIDEFKIWSAPKTDFGMVARSLRQDRPELLYHCTFDSAGAVERPAAGPNGTFLGGTFENGKKDKALRVRKGVSSAIVPFEKGVLGPRGTIEFWAKIENDREQFGDGGDPRFFMLVTSPGSETLLQFAANDGCGHGGLSAYHQWMNLASEDHCLYPARYDAVLPSDIKAWHHYALVWDEDGVPGSDTFESVAVFVDGKRIRMFGDTGPVNAHRMASKFRDNPATLFFSLDPALNHGFNNKTDFLIDEFKIWSAPKTVFDIR